jgi:cell division protein FtsW
VFIAGHATNGAQRWIPLFGFQFQPSELAKGTMILATAQILSAMQTENGADRQAFKYILIVGATIIPLIFVENFSTAALLSAVVFMMMVIGRVPTQQLGKLLGVSVTLVGLFIAVVLIFGKEEKPLDKDKKLTEKVELATDDKAKEEEGLVSKVFHRFGTWKGRILKFASNEEVLAKDYDLDENGQVGHANIAIASSNIVGKGPGNSESRDWLPQAFSDFIFAIIIEELGLLGAIVVAFLYIILLMRAGRIANRCENTFPAFLAMGLALLIVTQALFNMCVAVGLAPVTGQPLPLVSKGGTSTITSCIYIGMILSISRSAKKKQGEEDETSKKNIVKA